jgi:hypothetical protein
MAKVKEVREVPGGGFGGYRKEVRVRKLEAHEDLPEGAVVVPNDTPEHDWKEEEG